MKISGLLPAIAVVFLHHASSALALEFHGYLRSGIGFSDGDTDQVCFRAYGREGFSQKHRLGNECDTYLETVFVHDFLERTDDVKQAWARGQVTFSFTTLGHRDYEPTTPEIAATLNPDTNAIDVRSSTQLEFALREAFVIVGNILAEDVKLWMGKRYYRRKDIHMLDFYQLDSSGPGGGIEDLPVGLGKLHLALFRNAPPADGPAQTTIDMRWTIDQVGPGNLETVVLLARAGGRHAQTGEKLYETIEGYSAQLFYGHAFTASGWNTLMLQYGAGLFGARGDWQSSLIDQRGAWGSQNIPLNNRDLLRQRQGSSTIRVIDHLVFNQLGDSWSLGVLAMYQNVNYNGELNSNGSAIPNKIEQTYGLRPLYYFSEQYSLMSELGYSRVDNSIYQSTSNTYQNSELGKVTLATVISPKKGYWFRPQLRVFATYAEWNRHAKGLVAGNTVYADQTSGYSAGMQLEAWW
ncbi:MAG: maltoporin [Oligoflexus sp.]